MADNNAGPITFELDDEKRKAMERLANQTPQLSDDVVDGELAEDVSAAFPPWNCAFCPPEV